MIATYLILSLLAVYPAFRGAGDVDAVAYYTLVGVALAGVLVVQSLPWERIFAAGHGNTLRYAWSVLDIVLITAVIEVTGGGASSPMFMLYALTTIFFAASYPRRGQLALFLFTVACYLAVVPGTGLEPAVLFARLATLGVLGFMGSFISGELVQQMSESDRRAGLVATVAGAASQVSVLEPDDVLKAVVDCVARLGLEAGDLCLLDEASGTYLVMEARGLPAEYSDHPHRSDGGLVGRVRAERRTVTSDDYSASPDAVEELRGAGFRAVAATPVWVQGELVAVLEGGTRQSPAISRDVVEALELLAALAGRALENARRFEDERRMVESLAQLDRLKSDFISTASHELRTPLTVVLGMATTLVARWGTLDDETRIRLLERVEANAQRLDQIVNSLLDFSRIESGALDVKAEVLNLGALGREVADRLAPLFAEHPFGVEVDLEAWVDGDARLLERVVENLLANAAKHTEAGTPVTLGVRRDDGAVVLEVRDEGAGIPPDEMEHLTERFFRGGDPNTRTSGGLGLGLAIVREILLRHGATLEITSEPGRGSSFGFRLPAVPVPAQAPAPAN